MGQRDRKVGRKAGKSGVGREAGRHEGGRGSGGGGAETGRGEGEVGRQGTASMMLHEKPAKKTWRLAMSSDVQSES